MCLKNGKLSSQNIKIKLKGKFAIIIHRNLASWLLLMEIQLRSYCATVILYPWVFHGTISIPDSPSTVFKSISSVLFFQILFHSWSQSNKYFPLGQNFKQALNILVLGWVPSHTLCSSFAIFGYWLVHFFTYICDTEFFL